MVKIDLSRVVNWDWSPLTKRNVTSISFFFFFLFLFLYTNFLFMLFNFFFGNGGIG